MHPVTNINLQPLTRPKKSALIKVLVENPNRTPTLQPISDQDVKYPRYSFGDISLK